IQKQQTASMSVAPKLNTIIDGVIRDSNFVHSRNHFENMLIHDTEESFAGFKESTLGEEFLNALSASGDQSPTTSIQLYTNLPEDHPVYRDPDFSRHVQPISEITRTYWYGIFQGSNILQLHCPKFYLGDHESHSYGDTAYITKTYVMYKNEPITIYTAVYYSSETFMDILSSTITIPESVAYLINSRDSIVVSTDNALSGTYMFGYDTVKEASGSSNNFVTKKILGQDVYASFYRLESPDWFLIVAIPSTPLIKQARDLMTKITLLYLLVMLIAGAIAINLSRSITNRLSAVSERMLTARTGIPQPVELTGYHDEIGNLAETYNYMSVQIQQLMEEKQQFVERMRITELNALQAQINPHFLHNTKEMISWLAMNGQSQ
ncbi:MAG: histidine kinase, partial [Eubacterium sp.]|nr:histidine kinase [Eubacterium sp.]